MFPQQINRFEIKAELSSHERAIVYRAFDPQLQREVALKLFKLNFLYTLTSRRRFEEGMQKLVALNHPSLLPIYDFGREDNQPFFVAPLMEGGNLTKRLSSGPMSFDETLGLFTPLAEALDYAADQGFVHRNLKPNNILFDEHEHPFVAEIGVIQVLDSITTTRLPDTNPDYISPEQVRNRPLEKRSHVYSLGAIVYQALSGKALFEGATEMVTMFKHTSQDPQRPSVFRPELKGPVEKVLLRAVEKRPEERFSSAAEFMGALKTAIGGELPPEITPEEVIEYKESHPSPWEEQQDFEIGHGEEIGHSMSLGHTDTFGHTEAYGHTEFQPTATPKVTEQSAIQPQNLRWIITLAFVLVICLGIFIAGIFALFLNTGTESSNSGIDIDLFEQTSANTEETAIAATAISEAQLATGSAIETILQNGRNMPYVLISDPFDENQFGWFDTEEDDQYALIDWEINSKYVWTMTAKQGFVWRVWPDMVDVDDLYLSVEAQRISGSTDTQYGLIFNANEDDYYYFEVREDQNFRLFAHYQDSWETLIDFTNSSSIEPASKNLLEVIVQGDHILLYINGELVGETFDNRLESGKAGLIVGLSNQGDEAIVEFDDFEVRTPEQPAPTADPNP